MHTEQEMMARRVEAQGLGAQLPAQATNAFGRKLKAVLNDLRIGQAARDFGAAHAGYDRAETVRGIVARCEALLGVPPAGGPGDG
jgi:UDP:flavonoid glycosyltransferase YjiC (YdhE family)